MVAVHRKHHAHADREGDPHSIHLGFKWAHVDSIYQHNVALPTEEEMRHYAPDLYAEPFYRALQWMSLPLQIALGLLLFALGGWPFVIWGIFVRLVLSYHSTWLVNSAAHMLGYRTFRTGDQSTNCWWVALISFGEGWHNNHHAFPFSARHGLRWFEIDMTWWHVKLLAFLRLADSINPEQAHAAAPARGSTERRQTGSASRPISRAREAAQERRRAFVLQQERLAESGVRNQKLAERAIPRTSEGSRRTRVLCTGGT